MTWHQLNDEMLTIRADKAKKLSRKCPVCNRRIYGTGKLSFDPDNSTWLVEYYCPRSNEYFETYTPESQEKATAIAREVLGDRYPSAK